MPVLTGGKDRTETPPDGPGDLRRLLPKLQPVDLIAACRVADEEDFAAGRSDGRMGFVSGERGNFRFGPGFQVPGPKIPLQFPRFPPGGIFSPEKNGLAVREKSNVVFIRKSIRHFPEVMASIIAKINVV